MDIVYFKSKKQAMDFLKKSPDEWKMTLEYEPYGQLAGFYEDGVLIACLSFAVYDDELHIYTYEVSSKFRGDGYGKECYEMFLSELDEEFNTITLDYLDTSAKSFWEHLGFVDDPDGDSKYSMILHL